MNGNWALYDRLISDIPEELTVEDYCVGCSWTMVTAERQCGMALTVRQRAGREIVSGSLAGTPLREAAALVKSWDFIEASIGMAAMNAWYNRKSRVKELGILPSDASENRGSDAFVMFVDAVKNKKVAVIGHFPNIERQFAPICELSVLEREPRPGDYPDSACEYILGEQDFVFITGMTFINKTLPHLLELCRPDATVCLVGPSVPLSGELANFGVDHLSSFCVTDGPMAGDLLRRGVKQKIFKCGSMVHLPVPI